MVLDGFPNVDRPTVALDGADHIEPAVQTGTSASDLDLDAVVAALAEVDPYETLESLVDRVSASPAAEYAGAIATFTGRVRRKNSSDDTPTEHLVFEKYESVTDERMVAIQEDLEARDGVFEVLLHHRTSSKRARTSCSSWSSRATTRRRSPPSPTVTTG